MKNTFKIWNKILERRTLNVEVVGGKKINQRKNKNKRGDKLLKLRSYVENEGMDWTRVGLNMELDWTRVGLNKSWVEHGVGLNIELSWTWSWVEHEVRLNMELGWTRVRSSDHLVSEIFNHSQGECNLPKLQKMDLIGQALPT